MLAAALAAELLALSMSFESPLAAARDTWWVQLAGNAPDFIRIAIAFLAAFFVLLAPRFKVTVEQARQSAAAQLWWPWLALHLLAVAGLYFAANATFGGSAAGANVSGRGLAVSAGLGIAVVVSWLLVFAPPHYWRALIARERLALPVALIVATAAWCGGQIARTYWRPMAGGTLFLADHLLHLVYAEVLADPSQLVLGTPTFLVRIAPQCSGYEGIGLVTVFLALYFWLFRARLRFPQALLLFPIGIVAVWLANVLRIAALVAIGTSYSPALALGGFHSQAGWLSFIGLALGFIAMTHRMQFFSSANRAGRAEKVDPVAAALLVPFLVLMGSTMVTAALSQGFDRLYPLRAVAVAAALLWFRRVYLRWDWGWSWPSLLIGGAVFVVWIAMERYTTIDDTSLRDGLAGLGGTETAIWIGFRVAGSVLVIPLVEEMAFRGYLLRRLAAADFLSIEAGRFTWVSFLLSSVAFGLMHGRWLAGTLAGMAYALAVYRRGKLGDAVVAHMTTNGLIAASALIFGKWSLWL
jgi:exosortase E/protease (VPEID-CTERM system)